MSSYDEWFTSLLGSPFTSRVDSAYRWPRHRDYLERCDASLTALKSEKTATTADQNTPALISIFHNELERLPSFFAHYRALGIRHFILVNHQTTDRSGDLLAAQPDVSLYSTSASYEASVGGQMWVTGLARRTGLGRWHIHVDADELLVYAGMETRDINDLIRLLERSNETRLYAPMIDMYSDRAVGRSALCEGETLLEVAPYFDPVAADHETYYLRSSSSTGRSVLLNLARSARLGSPIAGESGRVKHLMDKFPLSFWHEGTAYCSVHQPYPFEENPKKQLGALLHFKFAGDVVSSNRSIARVGEAWMGGIENAWYADAFEANRSLSFWHAQSKRFESPFSLIEEGLLDPIDWEAMR